MTQPRCLSIETLSFADLLVVLAYSRWVEIELVGNLHKLGT